MSKPSLDRLILLMCRETASRNGLSPLMAHLAPDLPSPVGGLQESDRPDRRRWIEALLPVARLHHPGGTIVPFAPKKTVTAARERSRGGVARAEGGRAQPTLQGDSVGRASDQVAASEG